MEPCPMRELREELLSPVVSCSPLLEILRDRGARMKDCWCAVQEGLHGAPGTLLNPQGFTVSWHGSPASPQFKVSGQSCFFVYVLTTCALLLPIWYIMGRKPLNPKPLNP